MYANLRVTTSRGKEMYAWKVEVKGDRTLVWLDDENDESSYAVPKGCLEIVGPVTVEASF